MGKGRLGGRNRQALHDPESEADFNSEIDPTTVMAGCDLVDRDYASSVMVSDIPESPGAAMLARQQLEDARKRDEQDCHPTRLFSRPASSGVGGPPTGFLFQAPNAQSKAPKQVFNPGPIYPGPPSTQPSLAPEENGNAEDQLCDQLSDSHSARNKSSSATVEDAFIGPAVHRPRQPSPTASLNQNVAHTDVPTVRHQVIEEQDDGTVPGRQKAHMKTASEDMAPFGGRPKNASPRDERFDFRPLNHDQVPSTTEQCLYNSAEEASYDLQLQEEIVGPRLALAQPETNTYAQNIPQTPLRHLAKTEATVTAPQEEHQATTDINYETIETSGEPQNFHGKDSVEENTLVEGKPEVPLEISHHSNPPRQPRKKRQRTTSKNSTMTPGSKPSGVNKSQPRMKHKFSFPLEENQPAPAVSILNEPSAEDLLFLIMRRTRQKEQSEKALLARQHDLELDNERLHQENQDCRANLDEVLAREQKGLSDFESHQAELHDCRTRFQKLKTWAKSMSKSYEELHKGSAELDAHRKSLTAAGAEMRKEIGIAIRSVVGLPESVEAMKSKISEAREVVNSTIVVADAVLTQKIVQLQTAQQENSQLKAHISRLAVDQKIANDATIKEQQEITAQLKKFEEQIGEVRKGIDSDPKTPPEIDQCLELVQNIHDRAHVSPENLTSLRNAIGTLSEKVTLSNKASVEARDAAVEVKSTIRNEITEEITTVVDSIRSDFSWNEELSEVKKDNAYLEAKMRGSHVAERELRLSLKLAEDRAEKTQKSMETVLKSFGEGQSKTDGTMIQKNMQLSNTISQKTIQYGQLVAECTNQRNKVVNLEESMSRKEAEVQKLMEQLTNAEAAGAKIRGDLNKVREQIKSQASDHDTILNRQLSGKDSELNVLREIENSLTQSLSGKESELNVLRETEKSLNQKLSGKESELNVFRETEKSITQKLSEKENELTVLREAEKSLNQQLSGKENELTVLRKTEKSFTQQLSGAVKEAELLKATQAEQHEALKAARKEHETSLIHVIEAEKEILHLKNEMKDLPQLQKEATRVAPLLKDINTKDQQITQLSKSHGQAVAKSATLDAEVASLKAKLKTSAGQDQELRTANQQIETLEEQIQNGGAEVTKLKIKLEELQSVADRVKGLEEDLGIKAKELESSKTQFNSLQRTAYQDRERVLKIGSMQVQLNDATTEIRELKESKTSLEGTLTNATTEITKLKGNNISLQGTLTKAETISEQLTALQTEISEKTAAIERLQTEKTALDKKVAALETRAGEVTELETTLHEIRDATDKKTTEVEALNSTIKGLNSSLAEAHKEAAKVQGLQNDVQSKASEIHALNSMIIKLKQDLESVQKTAKDVKTLETEIHQHGIVVSDLTSKIESLNGRLSKAEETAAKVPKLEASIEAKDNHITNLSSKVMQSESLCQQIVDLQTSAAEFQTRVGGLEAELEAVRPVAEKSRTLQEAHNQKDIEIAELQTRLSAAEETVDGMAQLKEDCQHRDSDVATLRKRTMELEQGSPEIPESNWRTQEDIPENFLSQDTILSLDEYIVENNGSQDEDHSADNHRRKQAERLSTRQSQLNQPQTRAPGRGSDARSRFRLGLKGRAGSVHSSTLINASDPRSAVSITRIPDTQVERPEADNAVVVKNSQELPTSRIPSSSSLSDIGDMFPSSESEGDSMLEPAFHNSGKKSARQGRRPYTGDDVTNKTPSSSHGEQMLLEHLETQEEEEPLTTRLAKRFVVDTQAGESQRTTIRTIATPVKGRTQPSASQAIPWNREKLITDPRRHNVAGLHTPLRQQTHSELNMVASSSPGAGRERYQPNSAAKRRIEPEETPSAGASTTKKLKRMPGNLEVKKPTKDFLAIPQREVASASRPDLPSGSRKGSIIGANAPALGKTPRTSARKGSKNDRYSTRFSQQS